MKMQNFRAQTINSHNHSQRLKNFKKTGTQAYPVLDMFLNLGFDFPTSPYKAGRPDNIKLSGRP